MKAHNPDGLSPEQVEDGWRLLWEDEVIPNQPPLQVIECWYDGWWRDWHAGTVPFQTYRTRLTPDQLSRARNGEQFLDALSEVKKLKQQAARLTQERDALLAKCAEGGARG